AGEAAAAARDSAFVAAPLGWVAATVAVNSEAGAAVALARGIAADNEAGEAAAAAPGSAFAAAPLGWVAATVAVNSEAGAAVALARGIAADNEAGEAAAAARDSAFVAAPLAPACNSQLPESSARNWAGNSVGGGAASSAWSVAAAVGNGVGTVEMASAGLDAASTLAKSSWASASRSASTDPASRLLVLLVGAARVELAEALRSTARSDPVSVLAHESSGVSDHGEGASSGNDVGAFAWVRSARLPAAAGPLCG
ncbi:MAG: hypothetical protein ACOH1L_03710, partial [Thermomonas sp.]